MNKINRFYLASSLVLFAFFFNSHAAYTQIPKLFLKFVEKQNKVQSGYVKLQRTDIIDADTLIRAQKGFFISTPKDFKYLVCNHQPKHPHSLTNACKLAHTIVYIDSNSLYKSVNYWFDNEISDATELSGFLHPTIKGISVDDWREHIFKRIPSKINKKNIRYKILYPDQEQDQLTNISQEFEFDKKTFNCIQEELSLNYFKTEWMYRRIDVFEQQLYDFIHSDILDTISFMFEYIRKGYDRQIAEKQAKIDSAFIDSIVNSVSNNAGIRAEKIPQDAQKATLFFMPEWKFPLLSGNTLYSDSINSRFLLIDMWYIACHPCRLAMRELASIDTLYDKSLLKMLSINISDKDTAKIRQVLKNLNLKCDVALAYDNRYDIEMSKKMGECQGYPQLYLIDMKTRQVIWRSCGWYKGFTKNIEEIIDEKKMKNNYFSLK